jgi:threonine aldolase
MPYTNGIADFRSDTVTHPTDAMRRAMAAADVGDDVYAEDPTINALQDEVAALLGKEAALFTPSGTMANQLAIGAQTNPGEEVICVETAHVRNYEHGGASANFGVSFRTVPSPNGEMTEEAIRRAAAGTPYHLPRVTLLAWENTHNVSGGTVVPQHLIREGSAYAHSIGLRVHIDGARLWNASMASGVAAAEIVAPADSVMFCFSKGLGAPVGSILVGDDAFIAEARWMRGRLGGGMRQAGVLAAAAKVALDGRERLAEDHANARRLADGIAAQHPDAVDPAAVSTNMVVVREAGLPVSADELIDRLDRAGVRTALITPGVIRFCTHHNVDAADVDRVLEVTGSLRS